MPKPFQQITSVSDIPTEEIKKEPGSSKDLIHRSTRAGASYFAPIGLSLAGLTGIVPASPTAAYWARKRARLPAVLTWHPVDHAELYRFGTHEWTRILSRLRSSLSCMSPCNRIGGLSGCN